MTKEVRAAFKKIKKDKLLSPARMRVYAFLVRNGPSTAGEVTQALHADDTGNPSFHRRLAELARLGVVHRGEKFVCSVTGRMAVVWTPTEKLPKGKIEYRRNGILRETLYLGVDEIGHLISRVQRVNKRYHPTKALIDLCDWLVHRAASAR